MFKFEFNEQMTNVIAEALSNMPYRVSAPVIEELQRQIRPQLEQRAQGGNGAGREAHAKGDHAQAP